MKFTCAQCGKEFELTNEQISYYVTHDMPLPKRCEECRGEAPAKAAKSADAPVVKKSDGIEYSTPHGGDDDTFDPSTIKSEAKLYKRPSEKRVAIILLVIVAVVVGVICTVMSLSGKKGKIYTFKDAAALEENYVKYGIDMWFDETTEYEKAANAVINNEDAISKKSEATGETFYLVPETKELVIVSEDGYITTYQKSREAESFFYNQ